MKSLCGALVALLLFAAPAKAAAPDYPPPWPATDVTIVMPFSKGSETDLLMALFRKPLTMQTGRVVTERFISGQAGADAWARIQDAPDNGSVLTAVLLPHLLLRPLQPDSGIDPAMMRICHIIAYTPCVLWSTNPGAFDTAEAFTDTARSMDGNLPVAGPGRYSAAQIAARALDRQAGVKTLYVPYAGTLEAAKAALNQDASLFWGHSVHLPEPGNTVKPLAVAAQKRLPGLPGVATLRESGFDVVEGVYYGIAVPANTPALTRQEISDFFSSAAASAEFRNKATSLGFVPLNVPLADVPAFLTRENAALKEKFEEYNLATQ